MYVCMYVCMYTMILPLHFSVPIYSPWQKKKKKKKNSQKIKRGAGPLPGPESMYVCMYIPLLYIKLCIYRGWQAVTGNARSLI